MYLLVHCGSRLSWMLVVLLCTTRGHCWYLASLFMNILLHDYMLLHLLAPLQGCCTLWAPPSALLSCTRVLYLTASSTLHQSQLQVSSPWEAEVVMLLEHPANQGGVSDLPLSVSYYQLKLNLRCKLVCGWKSCYMRIIFSASCFMVTVRSAPQTLMKNWTINTIRRRGWSSSSPSRCPELLQELLLASLVCLHLLLLPLTRFNLLLVLIIPSFVFSSSLSVFSFFLLLYRLHLLLSLLLLLALHFFPSCPCSCSQDVGLRGMTELRLLLLKGNYCLTRSATLILSQLSSPLLSARRLWTSARRCWSSPTIFWRNSDKLNSCYFAHLRLRICWNCKSIYLTLILMYSQYHNLIQSL